MAITHKALADQFYRARAEWPFIVDVELRFGLPRCLLFAVGSRETNLTNERGDGGHGWGVWQLDDRYHQIPPGYLDDVRQQALDAAAHLAANYARLGDWTAACNAYNSGRPQTSSTTGGDYGPDVMDRAAFFESIASPLPSPPTPAPAPPVPPLDLPGDDDMPLQLLTINVGPLGQHGEGAMLFDGGPPGGGIAHNVPIRWDQVRSVEVQGSFPPADGYWPLPKVGRQERDGWLCVELVDGAPGQSPVNLLITVAAA